MATQFTPMRLDKLRGYGPWFAFAVPFLFLFSMGYIVVVHSIGHLSSNTAPPAWIGPAEAIWILLWALIILAGLVVALDLEWIEHPRTNTPMTYVGLAGMAIASLGFVVILFGAALNIANDAVFAIAGLCLFAGMGVYLVVMNLVGLRANLLGRVLPWIGIVSGALFLIPVLALFVPGNGVLLLIFPAWALYLGWSLWLGFRLRGKAPVPATS
jgi:hypothetical protein